MDMTRTAYHIHGTELMKLIFTVLYVSWTMGYKTIVAIKRKIFLHIYDLKVT